MLNRMIHGWLGLALSLSFHSAKATVAAESVDPKFGFELETRGLIGEGLAYTNTDLLIAASAVYATVRTVFNVDPLPLVDAYYFFWPALTIPAMMQAKARIPVQRAYQRYIFDRQNKPYLFEEGRIINGETGWWLEPKFDLYVVETVTKPATVGELRENVSFMNATTYNRLTTLGAGAAILFGSGHIHIDRESAFGEDAQLFRDFVADLINHPGLYLGPLVRDRFSSWDPRRVSMAQIREVIARFDKGEITSVEHLGNKLREAGLKRTAGRGAALVVSSRHPTLELRFPRAPANGEEVVLWAEMFKARLNYLKANPGVELKPLRWRRTPVETYRQIKAYVTEAGLGWEPYQKLLPRRWRWLVGPIAEGRNQTCEKLLDTSS